MTGVGLKAGVNPWLKFYPSDWRADPALRMCSLAARGLWMEMLCVMHENAGILSINGNAITPPQLANLAGGGDVTELLAELEGAGVFSRRENDGAIYSRRMVRDIEKAERDKANGKKGGNPRVMAGVNPPDNREDKAQKPEARGQNITPVGPEGREVVDLSGMPREISTYAAQGINRDGATAVTCQKCGAVSGAPCVGPDGQDRIRPHMERYQMAAHLKQAPKTAEAIDWPARLQEFREHGTWPQAWGPKPGELGCKAIVSVKSSDPLVPYLEQARGKNFVFGGRGVASVTVEIYEQAIALRAAKEAA